MNRNNRRRGFTMAEMLIVVAIIAVLGAVAFIAVNQHQRSLERLERDSVAREIFVAAQNHLTMAKGQGYLGVSQDNYGEEDTEEGVYFFVVNQGDAFGESAQPSNMLDLMLPFGAIDETVRGGGSYIVRYHPESATVMDVFYCSNPAVDTRFGYNLSQDEEATLVSQWGDGVSPSKRNNYKGKVLGWYGGAEADSLNPITLEAPQILVENSDKLRVGIVDNNKTIGGSLQIIVKGELSNVQMVINLKDNDIPQTHVRMDTNKNVSDVTCDYAIILDDITVANMHFADLTGVKDGGDAQFIAGEDITVQAVAFDNTRISNIAYSAEITVNSLYEKLEEGEADDKGNVPMTASISSIRHLENLDKRVSKVEDIRIDGSSAFILNNAVQTSDLKWTVFKSNTSGASTVIQLYGTSGITTETGCYLPVVSTNVLAYDGNHHSVYDIKIDYAGNAGMFGTIVGDDKENPAEIKNLALIDFDIKQTDNGNAGALAGTLNTFKVENVIAYNSKTTKGVVAESGSAGGLIGSAKDCIIVKSAASLYVTSDTGDAGGLVGETDAGSVHGCFSGGHTHDGTYYQTNDEGEKSPDYNITAKAGNAGGLIGVATSTIIDHSYATCSVTGATAGGFVASAAGNISSCYATGLVAGTGSDSITTAVNGVSTTKTVTKDGAFAYSLTGTVSDCYYFEIINEREDAKFGYTYLSALGKEGENHNIKPLDADYVDDLSLNSYNNVNANPANWTDANAYDSKLIEYYGGKYNLRNVVKLGATGVNETETTVGNVTTPADFVATHYGDWPAPEIFVVNTK